MEYNIQLNMRLDDGALQTLLRTLDQGPHGLMRGIIDVIVAQKRTQDEAAMAASASQPEIVIEPEADQP